MNNGQTKNKNGIMIALIETVILVAFIFATVKVIQHFNSSSIVANKYCEALVEQDWVTAYSLLDVDDDGQFTSKEAFISTMENKYKFITDYKIKEGKRNLYTFEYNIPAGDYESIIKLVEQDEKSYFIFKNYKVKPTDLTVEDVTIVVPKDITVEINGIALDSKNEDSSSIMSTNDYEKTYVIDKMYAGTYLLELSGACWQSYTYKIEVSEYETFFYPETPYLSPDVVRDLTEGSAEILNEMYNSAIAGSDCASLTEAAKDDDVNGDDILSNYDYLRTGLELYNEGSFYNYLTFSNISGEIYSYYYDEEYLKVSLDLNFSYDYQYSSKEVDWYTDQTYYETEADTSTDSASFEYIYKDGQWMLSNLYVYNIVY